MSHKFFLEFDRSWITRQGPNLVHTPGFGPKGKGSSDRRKCYNYVIKNRSEINPKRVQVVPVVHHQYPWLFGPATLIGTRSIVYPCARGKCSLPCPCLLCDKKHPTCRGGQSCDCQDCRIQYDDHSNFHACLHMGCRFCHSIIQVLPQFNFFFLDKSKKIPNNGVASEEEIRPTFELPPCNKDLIKGFLVREKWAEKRENWSCGVQDDGIWCLGCSTMFFNMDMFKNHLLTKHGASKVFHHNCLNDETRQLPGTSCDQCSSTFGSKRDLTRHTESVHFKEQIDCPDCDSTFSRIDRYKVHRKNIHSQAHHQVHAISHKCGICEKLFSSKATLKRHTRERCNEQKFSCDHCQTKFLREHDLKRHTQRSINPDGSNKFICTHCDARLCNLKLLVKHIKTVHNSVFKKVLDECEGDERKESHVCEFCGKCFNSEQDALRHKVTHGVGDKNTCEVCNATFNLKKNYKRHLEEAYSESGKLKHVCPHCEKAFCTGRLLSGHVKKDHAGYDCPLCKRIFTTKQTLERHIGNRVAVTCEKCEEVYCNKKALENHVNIHH